MVEKELLKIYNDWFKKRDWKPFPFQKELLVKYLDGYHGILNAPTGSGKTYALWIPILIGYLKSQKDKKELKAPKGLQVLWITPIRALANDIKIAMEGACDELSIPWKIGVRTGDTSTSERTKQKKEIPNCLITTPESLHLMLAQKHYPDFFKELKVIVMDEWHELLGSKRGIQVELGLSRLKTICPGLKIWGISATIGNLDESLEVLLGEDIRFTKNTIIKADIKKKIVVETVLPDEIEKFPWGGHLGINLLEKVLPIIAAGRTTLLFTNTRSQTEIWYQRLLQAAPELAGVMAIHHGSLDNNLRAWVEKALHEETIKVVVCTASLDLGVDFRPVDTVIQVGGPKGIARFLQRAGRSGHQPGATSKIFFVPTNSLELIEGAALRTAIKEKRVESRHPMIRAFDVLIQYLVTLAVSDGFQEEIIFQEVKETFAYNSITRDEWLQLLTFVTSGGPSLHHYEEFNKVEVENGIHKVNSRKIAMMHRLSMGTIVSDAMMGVRYLKGGRIGTIEEYFIAKLKIGDVFSFAGRSLELIMIKDMEAIVRNSKQKKTVVPQWLGGKMPLSSQLSDMIRKKLTEAMDGNIQDVEIKKLKPLLDRQQELSIVPTEKELLIESIHTNEGHHLFVFPFEGRYVNEGMAALIAYRISKIKPLTYSISINDYGFELLSDQVMPIAEALSKGLLNNDNLMEDIQGGLNVSELARRKFRDIAHIAGLIFQGYPGKSKKNKHLQASSKLFFEVFREHELDNLLLKQAYDEVRYIYLDEIRLREAFKRIEKQKIMLLHPKKPTPFAFPIMVERFRDKMSTEKLDERVRRMIKQMEKD